MGGARNLVACGEALAELGETEGLDACYERLRELNERGVEFVWPCLVPRVIAMLDALSRRWDDATTYFEKALGLARRLGYRLELAATLFWYAKMRLARDAPGDAEAATAMLNEALQLYQEMGLPQRAEKVLAVKMQAQEKVAPRPHSQPTQGKENPALYHRGDPALGTGGCPQPGPPLRRAGHRHHPVHRHRGLHRAGPAPGRRGIPWASAGAQPHPQGAGGSPRRP